MKYDVVEIFKSIQGEGIYQGVSTVFIRFARCNLACSFCDTNREHSVIMTDEKINDTVFRLIDSSLYPHVCFTGGEPLLYNLAPLCACQHIAYSIETNGTIEPPNRNIRVNLSPKVPRENLKVNACYSLKILYPYLPGIFAEDFMDFPAQWRGIQPIWTNDVTENKRRIKEAALQADLIGFRLSLQLHKLIEWR